MRSDKKNTFRLMREQHQVSPAAKERVKEFNQLKKSLLGALESGRKTIPELAQATGMTLNEVSYNLLTLRKFGFVKEGEIDDMDEYYYYELKKQ